MATETLSFEDRQRAFLHELIAGVTDSVEVMTPSQWAEERRYLPASNSGLPGYYSYDVTPYIREIVDCLGIDSPIREVAIMKGVQLGLTTGALENFIGYAIEHVKTAPMMLVTADAELAQLRIDSFITPMLQLSGLDKCLKSSDEISNRKSPKTNKKIEWDGGGFLVPFGAKNANKLRSLPIRFLLNDEVDGWPATVGKDGDPVKLVRDRTAAYEQSRKILDISTPLLKGTSNIEKRFLLGDQRRYKVCCLKCGFPQVLRWKEEKLGVRTGIVWETQNGILVPDSVRYLCQNCQHPHINDDKVRLLSPAHGAHWEPDPKATPASPFIRSYHISALYSPVGMQTWAACVQKWLEAWDEQNGRAKDLAALQVFYNNVLGVAYELKGEKVRQDAVSAHRRREYSFGQVPNEYATEHCGSPVLLLTCAVDVHADCLSVAVIGWCRGRRAILIDYERLEGSTELVDNESTWGALRQIIEERAYTASDGSIYKIVQTFIDSGYRSDVVYDFCAEYQGGVSPVKGRDIPAGPIKEFSTFSNQAGTVCYMITVDMYKDRWSTALRREWDGFGLQPQGHFNAPHDITEKQLRELTVETKVPKPGQEKGYEWRRPSGAANELWDLLVYNSAALDIIAWDVCRNLFELDNVDWGVFFDDCEGAGGDQPRYFLKAN
jgi:terminase, large subunit